MSRYPRTSFVELHPSPCCRQRTAARQLNKPLDCYFSPSENRFIDVAQIFGSPASLGTITSAIISSLPLHSIFTIIGRKGDAVDTNERTNERTNTCNMSHQRTRTYSVQGGIFANRIEWLTTKVNTKSNRPRLSAIVDRATPPFLWTSNKLESNAKQRRQVR